MNVLREPLCKHSEELSDCRWSHQETLVIIMPGTIKSNRFGLEKAMECLKEIFLSTPECPSLWKEFHQDIISRGERVYSL